MYFTLYSDTEEYIHLLKKTISLLILRKPLTNHISAVVFFVNAILLTRYTSLSILHFHVYRFCYCKEMSSNFYEVT